MYIYICNVYMNIIEIQRSLRIYVHMYKSVYIYD